jgi:hypothetical protein
LKTIDLLLGVPPNSTQEASATALSDYFQETPQLEPRFDVLPQEVPLTTNPEPSAAANDELARAAEQQASVPAGLDEGGEDLQTVLRLRHEGAEAAGEPGVPVLTDDVEHRLASGSPDALALAASPGGPCPLAAVAGAPSGPSAAPAGPAAGRPLPATGGGVPLAIAAAGFALALALLRLRSAR